MSFTKIFNIRNLIIFLGLIFIFPSNNVNAQRRDHLTAEEIEIVRDVQEIDYRMIVFIKAIERRLIVLEGGIKKLDEKQQKKLTKEAEIWGELPKGTNTELISDIDKILDESISKIEDVADRNVESDLLPLAIHLMADRSKLLIPRIEKFSVDNKNAREIALINSIVKNCNEIIEASAKITRPDEKELSKRTKKI